MELCRRRPNSKERRLAPQITIGLLSDARGVPLDLDAFTAHVRQGHLPHAAILDCTASADVAERYAGNQRPLTAALPHCRRACALN